MKELIEYIEGKLPISNEILSELKARVVEKNLVKGEIILSENSAKKNTNFCCKWVSSLIL